MAIGPTQFGFMPINATLVGTTPGVTHLGEPPQNMPSLVVSAGTIASEHADAVMLGIISSDANNVPFARAFAASAAEAADGFGEYRSQCEAAGFLLKGGAGDRIGGGKTTHPYLTAERLKQLEQYVIYYSRNYRVDPDDLRQECVISILETLDRKVREGNAKPVMNMGLVALSSVQGMMPAYRLRQLKNELMNALELWELKQSGASNFEDRLKRAPNGVLEILKGIESEADAEALRERTKAVAHRINVRENPASLSEPIKEGKDYTLLDVLPDGSSSSTLEGAQFAEVGRLLSERRDLFRPEEVEVVHLMASGLAAIEIAKKLGVHSHTVKNRWSAASRKLHELLTPVVVNVPSPEAEVANDVPEVVQAKGVVEIPNEVIISDAPLPLKIELNLHGDGCIEGKKRRLIMPIETIAGALERANGDKRKASAEIGFHVFGIDYRIKQASVDSPLGRFKFYIPDHRGKIVFYRAAYEEALAVYKHRYEMQPRPAYSPDNVALYLLAAKGNFDVVSLMLKDIATPEEIATMIKGAQPGTMLAHIRERYKLFRSKTKTARN